MQNQGTGVTVVRQETGQPYAGKVFAAVHAHASDVPRLAGGLCARLIAEGYTGYLIRTTNDEKSGGGSMAENILNNEQEHLKMAAALGFKDVFDCYYRNHFMDAIAAVEIQSRLVFLFRLWKVDTVISFHPAGAAEEEADRRVTAHAVNEAARMAGESHDFQEHAEGGFSPHPVLERYWFCTGLDQPFNRVIDIGAQIERKIDAIAECRSQGGNRGSLLRARLQREGKRLALLGNDDRTADREYIRQFLLEESREAGKAHGFEYAERFFYEDWRPGRSRIDEFVEKHAVQI
jgi:LmbE family N-acetylglucosaminyl deacetylase